MTELGSGHFCNIYSTAKETRNFVSLKLIKNKIHVEFKKYSYMYFYMEPFFLNSIDFILNQFKSTCNKFSHFFCCWVYIYCYNYSEICES